MTAICDCPSTRGYLRMSAPAILRRAQAVEACTAAATASTTQSALPGSTHGPALPVNTLAGRCYCWYYSHRRGASLAILIV